MRLILSGLLTLPLLAPAGAQYPTAKARRDTCPVTVYARPSVPSPHAASDYFDRSRPSPTIRPNHVLAHRRRATAGSVEYSLLVHQPAPLGVVTLSAFAVHPESRRTWFLTSRCPFDEWLSGLTTMMEALRALPASVRK
jgi:hypothetical protein